MGILYKKGQTGVATAPTQGVMKKQPTYVTKDLEKAPLSSVQDYVVNSYAENPAEREKFMQDWNTRSKNVKMEHLDDSTTAFTAPVSSYGKYGDRYGRQYYVEGQDAIIDWIPKEQFDAEVAEWKAGNKKPIRKPISSESNLYTRKTW